MIQNVLVLFWWGKKKRELPKYILSRPFKGGKLKTQNSSTKLKVLAKLLKITAENKGND